MRVMVLVKATKDSEAGAMPSTELLEAMGKYNEELVNAGILLAAEGLHPSVKGKRVAFDGPTRTVMDGPFTETRELLAGFWLWKVKDMAEAVEWVKRCPNPMLGPSEIEIRPVFEAADFGDALTPEIAESEDRGDDHRGPAWRQAMSDRRCVRGAGRGDPVPAHRPLRVRNEMRQPAFVEGIHPSKFFQVPAPSSRRTLACAKPRHP